MQLIRLNKDKNIIMDSDIKEYLNSDYITLPINDSISYHVGDYILMGTIICNNISSISGKVSDVNKRYITIENDFKELIKNKEFKKKISEIELLKNIDNIKNIIVCSINDEPYVYNRIFLLKDYIREVLETINILSKYYKSDNNMIAIKNNESFIIDECLNVIGTYPNIKIALTSDEYLISKKEFLLKKLNMNADTLYLTIEDILSICCMLNGYLETTKYITIAGDAIDKSTVLKVKIGTPLKKILSRYVKINNKKVDIIVNGLICGYKLNNNELSITNDIDSILIMKKKNIKEYNCINCGLCESICPKDIKIHNGKNINQCIHCGLCSYVCPSHINLRKYLGDYNE